MARYIYLILSIIISSPKISIKSVEALPPLSVNSSNNSNLSNDDVIFVSVNATEEDVLKVSSRLR